MSLVTHRKFTGTNVFGDAEGADGVVGESLAVEILDRHRLVRHALTDDVRPVELALFLGGATSRLGHQHKLCNKCTLNDVTHTETSRAVTNLCSIHRLR